MSAELDAGYGAPLDMPMGTECSVHRHRSWVPVESHHIWPVGMGGPNTPENRVPLCANAHYTVHEVIRRLINGHGVVADSRRFSARVKALALRGWTEAGKPVHGSAGE